MQKYRQQERANRRISCLQGRQQRSEAPPRRLPRDTHSLVGRWTSAFAMGHLQDPIQRRRHLESTDMLDFVAQAVLRVFQHPPRHDFDHVGQLLHARENAWLPGRLSVSTQAFSACFGRKTALIHP